MISLRTLEDQQRAIRYILKPETKIRGGVEGKDIFILDKEGSCFASADQPTVRYSRRTSIRYVMVTTLSKHPVCFFATSLPLYFFFTNIGKCENYTKRFELSTYLHKIDSILRMSALTSFPHLTNNNNPYSKEHQIFTAHAMHPFPSLLSLQPSLS